MVSLKNGTCYTLIGKTARITAHGSSKDSSTHIKPQEQIILILYLKKAKESCNPCDQDGQCRAKIDNRRWGGGTYYLQAEHEYMNNCLLLPQLSICVRP